MSSAVPALDFGSMTQVIQFLMEIDKLKGVQRRTKVLGTQRQENSAEHSWHFAIAAMSLAPYAGDDVDIQRVIQMALLHDIVEIDAGDVLVYDLAARAAIHDQKWQRRAACSACCRRLSASISPLYGRNMKMAKAPMHASPCCWIAPCRC